MRTASGSVPAYNVQTAVDAEHALIVAQQVTTEANDQRNLLPMAEAAKQAVGAPALLNVVADAGYSNGEHAERCEGRGIVPHVPTAPSTTRAMGRYSIAASSSTRRTRIPSAVRQGNGWSVNNSRVKIVRLYTPDVLRSAEVVR